MLRMLLQALQLTFGWIANFGAIGQFNIIDVGIFNGRTQIIAADINDL